MQGNPDMPGSNTVKMTRLTTVAAVIDALGGLAAVAEWCEVSLKVTYHWRTLNMFPARYHDAMTKALKRKHYRAPASLWNQIDRKAA